MQSNLQGRFGKKDANRQTIAESGHGIKNINF